MTVKRKVRKATVEPEYYALSIDGNQTEFDTQGEVEDFLFNHIMGCLEDVNSDTDAYRDYIGILGREGDAEADVIWETAQGMVYHGWSHLDEGYPDDNGNLVYSAEITNDIEERAIGQIFYIEVYKDEYNGGVRKSSVRKAYICGITNEPVEFGDYYSNILSSAVGLMENLDRLEYPDDVKQNILQFTYDVQDRCYEIARFIRESKKASTRKSFNKMVRRRRYR